MHFLCVVYMFVFNMFVLLMIFFGTITRQVLIVYHL